MIGVTCIVLVGKGAVEELDKMLDFTTGEIWESIRPNVVSLQLINLPAAFLGHQTELDIICCLTHLTSLHVKNLKDSHAWNEPEPPLRLRERWEPLDKKGVLTGLAALTTLRSLNVPASLRGLGERALSSLVHLTGLTLTYMGENGSLAPVAELPRLLELSVKTALVLELPGQLHLPHLTHLHLHNVKRLTGCISSLCMLQSLWSLSCDEVSFSTRDDGVHFSGAIGSLAALTSVSLRSVQSMDHWGDPYDACLQLALLSPLPSLRELCVTSCSLRDCDDMPDELASLRRLDLSYNHYAYMPRLVGHKALSCINLKHQSPHLSENGFQLLEPLNDLLAALPALKVLNLYQDEQHWNMESLVHLADVEFSSQGRHASCSHAQVLFWA